MRIAVAVLASAAACGPSSPAAPLVRPTGPTTPVQPPQRTAELGESAVVGFANRTRMIESRHGGEIAVVAVTPDAGAVLSVDELGGVRLWPTLDGSKEPRIVDLPPGRALAIGRDPRGFVAATIDDAGGLTLAVIDADGITLQRASLPSEPAFVDLAMTSRGLIASRADHSIVLLGADGGIVERLAAGGGERIEALAARGDRIAVQIATPTERRLRWLRVAPGLQWGAWIPSQLAPDGAIAISPKGTRIAFLVGPAGGRMLAVIDAATGAVIDAEPLASTPDQDAVFADEDRIAVALPRTAARIVTIDGKTTAKPAPSATPTPRTPHHLAAANERVIATSSGELVLLDRAGRQYLGYDIESPTVAASGTGGTLLIGVGSSFALLDRELTMVGTPRLQLPALASIAELRNLDADRWLVEWASADTGRTSASVIDGASGARTDVFSDRTWVSAIGYEASTQLAAFGLGEKAEVYRYDPRAAKLIRLAGVARRAASYEQTAIVPLAPALADKAQLLVATIADRLTLRWVTDPAHLEQGTSIAIDATFAAADRAGNAYVWAHDGDAFATVIYRGGKQVAKLRAEQPVAIAPDPQGTRFVEITSQQVALVAHDGTRAWVLPVVGVNEVLWLADGTVALIGTSGLARVDVATGAVQAARCGWRFGLSPTQHRTSSRVEPLCARLR